MVAVLPVDRLFSVFTVNSLKGEATVAGPSAHCWGSVQAVWLQKLGGPNGNRTRLLAVTVRNTNRYTIRPRYYSQAPRMPI